MDFLSRLLSGPYAPKPATRSSVHDPQARLLRFKRVWIQIVELCNRPRNPESEAPLFEQLHISLDRLAGLIRDESRAPIPHVCLNFASKSHIYAVVARAAAVSQHEPIINSTISVFAALVDSEEEDFLSSGPFAKSLIRLVQRALDATNIWISVETETAILELLFTISAKIRLQPGILPVWFQSKAKAESSKDADEEKGGFVGSTQKDDFPLCYILIDRVHHAGRLGDFARTGLLYIFEATGRSVDLQEWVLSSDLATLMASGLGALYSQLSRELSILHPDSTLPAVLAMSDYSTTHTRATAESAFSTRHETHMATFLSYLAFWQDVLDHCRSAEVKQSLVDHFQVLFLQQLLYPSLLQSSDTDAGSSVAVLTYMTAMLEALEYPDLIHIMLVYLLNVQSDTMTASIASISSIRPLEGPPSPAAAKRRQSMMFADALSVSADGVEPTLFSLVDLLMNSIGSQNNQTSFAALKLISTLVSRQRPYALGTILKVDPTLDGLPVRTIGSLETEISLYSSLLSFSNAQTAQTTRSHLADDLRPIFEAQISWITPTFPAKELAAQTDGINGQLLPRNDPLSRAIIRRLRNFLTNPVDVNLALTQAIVSIATSGQIRVEGWLGLDANQIATEEETQIPERPWQAFLGDEQRSRWHAVQRAYRHRSPADEELPLVYQTLQRLKTELAEVEDTVPGLRQLVQGRRSMIQGASMEVMSNQPALTPRSSSLPRPNGVRQEAIDVERRPSTSFRESHTSSRSLKPDMTSNDERPSSNDADTATSPPPPIPSIFQPPPPETPSTTDILMQQITIPATGRRGGSTGNRTASLNHILTNVVVLEDFIWELVAVLQVRAAVFGAREVCFSL